jgi:hypothetical protein
MVGAFLISAVSSISVYWLRSAGDQCQISIKLRILFYLVFSSKNFKSSFLLFIRCKCISILVEKLYNGLYKIIFSKFRSTETLVEQFQKKPTCFFILTNSRALSSDKVEAIVDQKNITIYSLVLYRSSSFLSK